ncbi:MAG: sulfurtransferase-like selenium metabolism protein YedF [Ardenticatenaceae bacterium]|nr:sulfurtransferase-like selenium metabolism protein YedF [Ardenticatenaceae bacterium]MCB8986866.1 sulfurtransferase-like selenium metabolism protein YedF [Ardenticatenaceae bacterium]
MNFLYLNSDKMGEGDPDLGRKLLAIFLEKLAASAAQIDVVGCVNSAVFLTTEGSIVLDSLQALADRGARIVTCGTCLDHYGRRALLRIGEVGSMDGTVGMMMTADRVIRP